MAMKPPKPFTEDVHKKVLESFVRPDDKERAAYAVDAIKLYGIDDFFCEYRKFLEDHYAANIRQGVPTAWKLIYIHAAELYHGSKQHWRRRS